MSIAENVARILAELPEGVHLVAAAKTRQTSEIHQAIEAGIRIIGENYVQEAEKAFPETGNRVLWHFIGHLQKNKVKKAVGIFDMIETVDTAGLAGEIDKRCGHIGKIMPVLLEVNSGRENRKSGALPEKVEQLAEEISTLRHLKLMGLMTMGPASGDPEGARPYFSETRQIFEKVAKLDLPGVEMKYLSMGMTNSYRVAIEEGANIIRLGARIFGERMQQKSGE